MRVEKGFVLAADLPPGNWETHVMTSSPWVSQQTPNWGHQALLGRGVKIEQIILDLPPTADRGRIQSAWRALMGKDGTTPSQLPAGGSALLTSLVTRQNAAMERLSVESIRPIVPRYPDEQWGNWAFSIITAPARSSMVADSFEWSSGRFATLLIIARTGDAPPFDTIELLRKARARLDDAQKAN